MFYRWLLALLFLPQVLLSQSTASVELYKENQLWGLKAPTKPVTPASYDTLIRIENSTFYIARKHRVAYSVNNTGVISEKGKIIIPHEYLTVSYVNEAYLVSQWINGETRYGVLSASNEVVLATRFKAIQNLEHFWIARSQSNELKLYDQTGSIICGVNADSLTIAHPSGYFYTHKDGKLGLLTTSGNEITTPSYAQIDAIEGKWMAVSFPAWQIIQDNDTSYYSADSIRIWNNTLIKGYNNLFYLDKDNQRLSKTYNTIFPSSNNLAITKAGNEFGAISIAGNEILPNQFQDVYIEDGYLYAKKNSYWSLYDSLGNKKSVFNYDSIGISSEGLFPIQRKGKWGFMDRQGVEVIHCIYDSPASFTNGRAIIQYFNREGIIDNNGDWIVKPIYDEIIDYSFDFYVARLGEQYFQKTYEGEIVYFSPTPVPVSYSSQTAETAEGNTFEDIKANPEENSWKIIHVNEKYGFEGTDGLLKITYRYDSLLPFTEGLAAFRLRGKWGFINRFEQIIIQPNFSVIFSFSNGVAVVEQNNKYGVINTQGKFVLKPQYDSIEPVNGNFWLVTENGKKGLYGSSGSIVLHPFLDNILYVDDDHIIVVKNKMYGLVDGNGTSILPRTYDYIGYDLRYKTRILKKEPEKRIEIK